MEEKQINVYILQEMHLEGDYMKTLNSRYVITQNNPESEPKQQQPSCSQKNLTKDGEEQEIH